MSSGGDSDNSSGGDSDSDGGDSCGGSSGERQRRRVVTVALAMAVKCRPAALSEEDFNHLLEIRKRESDEMDDGGDNASS